MSKKNESTHVETLQAPQAPLAEVQPVAQVLTPAEELRLLEARKAALLGVQAQDARAELEAAAEKARAEGKQAEIVDVPGCLIPQLRVFN